MVSPLRLDVSQFLGRYVRTLLGWRLRGQGVELLGDCEALFNPIFQLLFSQHVHQFDAHQSGLRRLKPFEP